MSELVRGLTSLELTDLLGSPSFGQAVVALGHHSLSTQIEGGFAVYKDLANGQITVSEPVTPTAEEAEEERQGYNDTYTGTDYVDSSVSGRMFKAGVLLSDEATGRARRDVGMLVHSHPDGINVLRPSIDDMEWKSELDGFNPNLIAGIATATAQNARLLLYRESSTAQLRPFYQQLTKEPLKAADMIQLMNQNGYNTALARFDMSTARLLTNVGNISRALFR